MEHDREFAEITRRLRDEDPFIGIRARMAAATPPPALGRSVGLLAALVAALIVVSVLAVAMGVPALGAVAFLGCVLAADRVIRPLTGVEASERTPADLTDLRP